MFMVSPPFFGTVIVLENSNNVDCTAKQKIKAIYTKKAKCPEKSELLRAIKMWYSSHGSHMGQHTNTTRCLFRLLWHDGSPLSWIISRIISWKGAIVDRVQVIFHENVGLLAESGG